MVRAGTSAWAAALVAAALLIWPAAGQAANFCVHLPGTWCTGVSVGGAVDEQADLQQALNDAASPQYGGLDNVMVGPGTFTGNGSGFSYVSADPVDVVGASVGETVLGASGTNKVLTLGGGTNNNVVQLTLNILAHGYGLSLTGGTAQDIAVTAAAASTPQNGVALGAGAVLKQSTVDLTPASIDTHPVSVDPGSGNHATLTDDTVSGSYGIQVVSGSATMSRLRLDNSQQDLNVADGASGTIDDSLLLAHGTNQPALNATGTLTATSISAVGDGVGVGAESIAIQSGQHSALTLSDSTITGFATDLERYAGQPTAMADLTVRYSNFAPPISETGGGTEMTLDHNVNFTPGFVSGTDRHLRFDSPLIDAGPACSGLVCLLLEDLDQNARLVDGNGDGTVLRDIGAYEYQRRAPVASASAPATSAAAAPVLFDAGASHDPDPGDTLTYSWSFDDGGSAAGVTVAHAFSTGGTHTGTVTVTDPTGRTATATAAVAVSPPADGVSAGDDSAPLSAAITALRQSTIVWREGSKLARISRKHRPGIGTVFSFDLNKQANVTLTFTRRAPGRKLRGRCVAQNAHNRHKARCTRTIVAGTIAFTGHAGANKVRFAGRLSRTKKLKPGRYTLTAAAAASSRSVRFTIVK